MTRRKLPPKLIAALKHGHAEKDVWPTVQQLELFGVAVIVRRLQLGDMKAPEFGKFTVIYQTPEQELSSNV